MYQVFRNRINEKVVVYMDDITVYSRTHEEHHRDVEEVLQVLLENGLKLGKEKTVFCTERVDLLGFSVMGGKVFPNDERLVTFSRKLNIGTIKQLHSFLGSIGFVQGFIPDCSNRTYVSYQVINRKKASNEVDVEGLVESLRQDLVASEFVELPFMEQPFIVETDASDYCIGGVLKQSRKGKEVMIRFCSRNMIAAEKNYSVLGKEALAIVYASDGEPMTRVSLLTHLVDSSDTLFIFWPFLSKKIIASIS